MILYKSYLKVKNQASTKGLSLYLFNIFKKEVIDRKKKCGGEFYPYVDHEYIVKEKYWFTTPEYDCT